jgi:hypothetical protein
MEGDADAFRRVMWESGMTAQQAMQAIDLRGVVYQEGALWFAHCLELDIVAEGATPQEAVSNVLDLCDLQIASAVENNDLESIFRPAPAQYWSLFFQATRKSRVPKRAASKRLRRFDARELVLS